MAASVTSREHARELVEGISRKLGVMRKESLDEMEKWNVNIKREVQDTISHLTKGLGHMVMTVAKSIYSNNVRFLFEVLQNCDDNSYENAARRGETPLALFKQLESQEPLFPDLVPEAYLSQNYSSEDLDRLTAHGLSYMAGGPLLDRVQHDLDSTTSRMKTYTCEEWHRRAALMLQYPLTIKWDSNIAQLNRMKLLPLRDGKWSSINEGAVYFPEVTDTLTVPDGLALNIIDSAAAKHPERRKLFDLLGVETAPVQIVREQIFRRYLPEIRKHLTLEQSLQDLKFLYLTSDPGSPVQDIPSVCVFLQDKPETFAFPKDEDVFFLSEDDLSAYQLLTWVPPETDTESEAEPDAESDTELDSESIVFNDRFLDERYLGNPPCDASGKLPSWRNWLQSTIRIRHNLRLKDRSSGNLSTGFLWISRFRPEKLMALLKRLWRLEGASLRKNEVIKRQLRELPVLCAGGEFQQLFTTYLPTGPLTELANRFLEDGDPFFWLQLGDQPGSVVEEVYWEHLTVPLQFGLPTSDLEFGLRILYHMRDVFRKSDPDDEDFSTLKRTRRLYSYDRGSNGHEKLYDLYGYLEALVLGHSNQAYAQKQVLIIFQKPSVIFIPADENDAAKWVTSKDCLWTAPVSHVKTKSVLQPLYGKPGRDEASSSRQGGLANFFKNIVKVDKWSWETAIDEIECRRNGDANFDQIAELYRSLARPASSKEEGEHIRHAFATKELIYCQTNGVGKDWHKSSDCMWTLATTVPGKTPINNDGSYDDLEPFFLDVIKVQKMTARVLYEKLRNPFLNPPLEELRSDLLEFSAMLSDTTSDETNTPLEPNLIRNHLIFPARNPDGQVVRLRADDEFAIVDRVPLADSFRHKVKLLDFDLRDTLGLGPFIKWIGLGERYLSRCVQETFSADRTRSWPISEPHRQIHKKAGALFRIAVALGSPMVADGQDDLYRRLQGCETLETEGIHTTLKLSIPGKEPITEDKDGGPSLYIHEGPEGLKIFVPRNRADRVVSFQSKFPQHFKDWIMRSEDTNISGTSPRGLAGFPTDTALQAIQAVLNAEPCGLRGILESYGLPDIDSRYQDAQDDEDGNDRDRDGSDDGSQVRVLSLESRDSRSQTLNVHESGLEQISFPGIASSPGDTGDERAAWTPMPSTLSNSLTASLRDEDGSVSRDESQIPPSVVMHAAHDRQPYQALLEQIVAVARRLQFPSHGAFDMSGMAAALSENVGADPVTGLPFLRVYGRRERDNMVGAAGELFIYELLRNLDPALPDFTIGNWKSNIRGYVNVLPEYNDLQSWGGSEGADIKYTDRSGMFTSFLESKGYLDRFNVDQLRQARPTYHIEVKSTPYSYGTVFFMHRSQYRMMRRYSQSGPGQQGSFTDVYMVMRVFYLGKEHASLKVLVDPEGMRLRGELDFEADSWRVKPTSV